jgi:hypothetical protein
VIEAYCSADRDAEKKFCNVDARFWLMLTSRFIVGASSGKIQLKFTIPGLVFNKQLTNFSISPFI